MLSEQSPDTKPRGNRKQDVKRSDCRGSRLQVICIFFCFVLLFLSAFNFICRSYFPGFLQNVHAQRGKKKFVCLLGSPRFCGRSLRDTEAEGRLRTVLPGARTAPSSCSLARPVTRTVADTWMQKEPASGRDSGGSDLTLTKNTLCAGHWDGEATETSQVSAVGPPG